MTIFSVLTLLGGLAFFLFGMNLMGEGLEKLAGGKLEQILKKLTSSPIKGVLLGAVVTGIIQSSSATTVMVVGVVNSGLMKLEQTVGVIMGANIGTTVTSWLLSLTGIEGDSVLIRLLEPASFSPLFALAGLILWSQKKKEKYHSTGIIFLGFALIMFGMQTMSGAVQPLADMPEFTSYMTKFSNPLLGMAAGMILTAIIQSSSASVGILQALCVTGAVSYGAAIPIIMGQNIGTCITAILSSIGTGRNSKRAALIHLYFNVIGTVIFMVGFYLGDSLGWIHFSGKTASVFGIAVIHSLFNITTTLILLPFWKVLLKLAVISLPEKEQEKRESACLLEERFLESPAYALEQAGKVSEEFVKRVKDVMANTLIIKGNAKVGEEVLATDICNLRKDYQKIHNYLLQVSNHPLLEEDSRKTGWLLQSMAVYLRMADYGEEFRQISRKLLKKKKTLDKKLQKELYLLSDTLDYILSDSVEIFQILRQEGSGQDCIVLKKELRERGKQAEMQLKALRRSSRRCQKSDKSGSKTGTLIMEYSFMAETLVRDCMYVSTFIS